MKGKMNIHYNEEGDYLEIFIEGNSPSYGEEIGDDITIIKSEITNEVIGVGILNFKRRSKSISDTRLNLPFEINFSALKI